MNIVVCGAGQVGSHAAEVLIAAGHAITLIDDCAERIEAIEQNLDARVLMGNCANADVLREGGAGNADLLVAATGVDEINLLTASLGKGLGASKTLARVHHSAYFDQRGLDYQRHLNIDQIICPEFTTAQAIAAMLRNPGALAIENFGRGKIEMAELLVKPQAAAVGKTLIELGLPRGVRLVGIERGGQALLPDASTIIARGDAVILVGNTDVMPKVRKLFGKGNSGRQRVVIMGGSSMAVWLCRALHERGFAIRLFEPNRQRAEALSEKLEWVTVICDDPTDQSVFDEEHLADADVFIGLAEDDDEHNIITCASAKSMGIKQSIAVVQKPAYMHLLRPIGIDAAFIPRMLAAREIIGELATGSLLSVASLAQGVINVYRLVVPAEAQHVGKPLKELGITPHWMIAAIQHGHEVFVPSADDYLSAGDVALVVGISGTEDKLKGLLAD